MNKRRLKSAQSVQQNGQSSNLLSLSATGVAPFSPQIWRGFISREIYYVIYKPRSNSGFQTLSGIEKCPCMRISKVAVIDEGIPFFNKENITLAHGTGMPAPDYVDNLVRHKFLLSEKCYYIPHKVHCIRIRMHYTFAENKTAIFENLSCAQKHSMFVSLDIKFDQVRLLKPTIGKKLIERYCRYLSGSEGWVMEGTTS